MVVDNGNILFIGDIHSRTIRKDIAEKESWEQYIFLGDYFDPLYNK